MIGKRKFRAFIYSMITFSVLVILAYVIIPVGAVGAITPLGISISTILAAFGVTNAVAKFSGKESDPE